MSITVTTDVFCDAAGCEKFCGTTGQKMNARSARREAKEQGWVRVDGADFCPTHKPEWKLTKPKLKAPQE